MLDDVTKRRINTARDILVGKVPDPKSQVEQITIALIYKFMDDMDAGSEELGGHRKFFAGEFARYGWSHLMRPGLGGQEMLNLYAEAIERMPQNPGIPELFRSIFRNAYLPYRDPETLRSFLRVIDEFTYEHSERLGDAFEYLLLVLGAQGDAGQFRTPRHIIDFIVEIVDPKKDESILDPACGTAGFLISSYKHIQAANTDANGHSTLTPEQRGTLADNLMGYDISPDMVRLSLVNMYLHGMVNPHIYEYDTLTSDERWDKHFDVILANPPFMSPKGGIRPHNRFTVQSKRSEVLFVDYIAEHLKHGGRAGIIVPEGVIFQSQSAYKKLRQVLVRDHLVAVISLPAGIFNPYSGVKTSILILERKLAQQSNSIAFFSVESDGFSLGAQRRPVAQNDLPQIKDEVNGYFQAIRAHEPVADLKFGHVVSKVRISASGDDNLSSERYRDRASANLTFPVVKIGDICTINPRKSQLADLNPETTVAFVPMADLNEHRMLFQSQEVRQLSDVIAGYTYFEDNDVLLAKVTPCFENGKAGIARDLRNGIGFGSSEFFVLRSSGRVLPEWLYYCLMDPTFRESAIRQMTGTGGLQRVPRTFIENFAIPLPYLEKQQEIVNEIAAYQRVIDGARSVVEHYDAHVPVDPAWRTVTLDEVCELNPDDANPRSLYPESFFNYLDISSVENDTGRFLGATTVATGEAPSRARRGVRQRDVLISTVRPNLKAFTMLLEIPERAIASTGFSVLRAKTDRLIPLFLLTMLRTEDAVNQMIQKMQKGAYPSINGSDIKAIRIPLPPFDVQKEIVAEIESELGLVDANRELIARFERKIQATLSRVWGKVDLTQDEG